MPWKLLVIDGADEGESYPLVGNEPVTIGSKRKSASICLHDLYVGPKHCQLALDGGRVVVTHLEHPGGTFVNGQRITGPQELRPGDVLRVGNSHLRLEAAGDGTAPPAPAPAAAPPPPGKLPHLPPERLSELAGHVLGHYEVGAVLGRGHVGVVFRARELKTGQVVALKVLHPTFPAGDEEMKRFAEAMRNVLPLRHPHLVLLTNAGKTGPYCWLAPEHVEGESLTQALQRVAGGRMSWKSSLRLAIHLARALHYLHRRQLTHGNITPNNVLIRLSDKQVKLGDLMLGQAIEGSALQKATLEAKLLAELPYLAPEQADPDAFVDGPLADIYGLGAVVYARLTGRPPFQGRSPEETLELLREAPLVRPKKLNDSIPDALDVAVVRMLERRQEARYPTAADLLGDLEPLAEEEGVEV